MAWVAGLGLAQVPDPRELEADAVRRNKKQIGLARVHRSERRRAEVVVEADVHAPLPVGAETRAEREVTDAWRGLVVDLEKHGERVPFTQCIKHVLTL